MSESSTHEQERAAEQSYVDVLYARLDADRERAAAALDQVRRGPTAGTPGALTERDAFTDLHTGRLAVLRGIEERLCFGRLDLLPETADADGEHDIADAQTGLQRRYVGRIGLHDDDGTRLLVDWRAPAAESFYQATAAQPGGVIRRRHISTRGRTVTGVEDDVLDLDAFEKSGEAAEALSGDGALMLALDAHRTGRMRDIVATIQTEQDRIIRSPLAGVLVVEGGPGTGKTAVALHRAAFLLYAHRERIAKSGVLLVGPGSVFLRYVEQVLPSLGETGVLLRTAGQLYPGVDARAVEPGEVAALKGDARMAQLLDGAVRARQRVPKQSTGLDIDGTIVMLKPGDIVGARDRARRNHKPHNEARAGFVKDVLGRLATRLANQLGVELDSDNRSELLATLRESPDVRREVNLCWMPLSPERVLADLFADPARLAAAVAASPEHRLSPTEQALLRRERGAPWTPADVPLLDELAELVGIDDTADQVAAARAAQERKLEVDYAKQVLEMSGTGDMLTADTLVDRYSATSERLTVAERAADDRTWTFGHIVVDEAQELSPMMWRVLMRRCPARSMTIVGDLAQTSVLSGADSWGQMLDPFVADRWRREELTVNYRTPRQVMEVASSVLAAAGVQARVPESPRDGKWEPTARRVPVTLDDSQFDVAAVTQQVREELALVDEGTVAVLAPRALVASVATAVHDAFPTHTVAGAGELDAQVSVMSVRDSKGLEFDSIVLIEPADVITDSPRGANDLYVALTRPTQRLTVLHAKDLPAGFDALPSP